MADLPPEKRATSRVEFSKAVDVKIVAIDGTWSRPCKMPDVSQDGAKLAIEHIETLHSKEFFLQLSSTGAAYRRCKLAWVNGQQIGVSFLSESRNKRPKK
jgi:hypothetical protein